ncbi:hypothetical protein EOL71_03285 [Candidatus Saccharibacteria bacterium]|nr:hypothetical protein [Candidatus Saccharibacteria bacterium]
MAGDLDSGGSRWQGGLPWRKGRFTEMQLQVLGWYATMTAMNALIVLQHHLSGDCGMPEQRKPATNQAWGQRL